MIPKHISEFCNDDITKIENYEQAMNDTTQTWDCHHRLETDLNLTKQELIDRKLYFKRPASELIFLTHAEHTSLHMSGKTSPNKGILMSEVTKKKMSEARKGKHHSEETKKKIGAAHKGMHRSEEAKKKMSESIKRKYLSDEYRRKISEAIKGRIRINNGVKTKLIYPNELDYYISLGYIKGALKRK